MPPTHRHPLTKYGCETLDRLVTARRGHLTEVISDWEPGMEEEFRVRFQEMLRDLVPDAPVRA